MSSALAVTESPDLSPPSALFRRSDWYAAGVAFLIAWISYVAMLAPNVTLEDSGELITAAHNLGVPHPPGYPIWTVLGYLFDHLNPLSPQPVPEGVDISRRAYNIAWRVNFMSATFGALTAGLLALLISRTGSMFLRSRKDFAEAISENLEHWLVGVCAVVGALIFAYSPVPLSQAVIGEVYTLNGLFMALTLVTLMIWMSDRRRNRYLYLTCFFWGLGLTNHQTLLFMAPAYFILVAIVDLAALMDLIVAACFVIAAGCWFLQWLLEKPDLNNFWFGVIAAIIPAFVYLVGDLLALRYKLPVRVNWKRAAIVAACVLVGMCFYGYMPLASSTNPPMNWGFTNNKDGFWHHITRGQYEKVSVYRPFLTFLEQLYFFGLEFWNQYTIIFVAVALVSVFWFFQTDSRAKKWLAFVASGIFCTSFIFIVLANPNLDRAVATNDRVFFLTTHALFCICVGYGLIWGMAYFNKFFTELRWPAYGLALLACVVQLGFQYVNLHSLGDDKASAIEWLWVEIEVGIFFLFSMVLLLARGNSLPWKPILALVSVLPMVGLARNWSDNEQQGHMFGWYFGYHMFEPGGGYPSMDKDAILYGGTDPGRFVPTYMIFCPRVHPDVYIITQNALAENTYLRYLRAQYSPSRHVADTRLLGQFGSWLGGFLGRDSVYPKQDIYISNDADSSAAIRSYVEELQRRPALPGEQVTVTPEGKVNIAGVQAVTALNGLISKQIFDQERDKHTFYVEESFVIQWMYPYLEPYGIIMKINHDPLAKITPDKVMLNHQFWTAYIDRYLLSDPRFRRDDDAQKAFSKLRTAHAGLYAWRTVMAPPEMRQPELAGEAEFAFQQATNLCPFNVEAHFRYAEFLSRLDRYDDSLRVIENYRKFDPANKQVDAVLKQIAGLKNLAEQEGRARMELQVNPGNYNAQMQLLIALAQRGKFGDMDVMIDRMLQDKGLPAQCFQTIIDSYAQMGRVDRVELSTRKYLELYPDNAQNWYMLCLASTQLQKPDQAFDALEKAVALNPQLKQMAEGDQRLNAIRYYPRYKRIMQQ